MTKPDATSFRKRVYSHMLETRGQKYKWFLRALRAFKFISMSPTRGEFLENYYTLMRYIDDIVDGDATIPSNYPTSEEFVSDKIRFAHNLNEPKDEVDYMILHCFKTGARFGEEFSQETEDILSSMLFDAKRAGKRIIFPRNELEHHFHLLDVRGTVRAALKVFDEDVSKYGLVQPLGLAARINYNLRDYDSDVRAGLFNIPLEDYIRLNIKNLEDKLSPEVQTWFREQANLGLKLLQKHHEITNDEFGLLATLTFPLIYERPARKCFEQVLSSQ